MTYIFPAIRDLQVEFNYIRLDSHIWGQSEKVNSHAVGVRFKNECKNEYQSDNEKTRS